MLTSLTKVRRSLGLAAALLTTVGSADAVLTAGNDYYQVHVAETGNVGQYTATTGPLHPSGSGLNVIFGNGVPGTSFTTIRSYTSGTDYVQDGAATSANPTVELGPLGSVEAIGSTGFRTTYNVIGADSLRIIQEIKVNGSSFEDSTIELTTTIENTGTATVRIGVRHHIDYQIGSDDGPIFQPLNTAQDDFVTCEPRTTEAQFYFPTFDAYAIEDNDVNANPPTFDIFGTVNGPDGVAPEPTAPDLLQYVCWPTANSTAFSYTIDPTRDVANEGSSCGGNGGDSAVNYYFGSSSSSALVIPAGGSRTVSISLFLRPVSEPVSVGCITRDARFWFTRGTNANPDCVTLERAIGLNCDSMNLGFLTIPRGYHNDNNVLDSEDGLIEALGLYHRSTSYTGELGGSQYEKRRASALCGQRKRTAVEFIAALANTVMFGTQPGDCTYRNGSVTTNFPPDLIEQARDTLAGEDLVAVRAMAVLLRKFNLSGAKAQFPEPLQACSQDRITTLRQMSRDPTTQLNCPGVNDLCETAETIIFPTNTNIFATPRYVRTVNLTGYTDAISSSFCGAGGRDAVWKLSLPIAQPGRRFTVSTMGSNFDTIVSVYRGTCDLLEPVACSDDVFPRVQSATSFTTDGESVYFIVVEGKNGAYGRAQLQVTSP